MVYKFHVRFDTLETISHTDFFVCVTAVVSTWSLVILKDLQSKLPMDKITAYKNSRGLGFGGYVKSSVVEVVCVAAHCCIFDIHFVNLIWDT